MTRTEGPCTGRLDHATQFGAPTLCRSCTQPIAWCHTTGGKVQPVDPEPVADGNLAVWIDGTGVRHCKVEPASLFDDGDRYMPHHATCPDPAWRRR